LTPKIGQAYHVQNRLQSPRKFIFQYIEHPKIKFYTFFLLIPTKKRRV
jgi:hypothetical protein